MKLHWNSAWIGKITQRGIRVENGRNIIPKLSRYRMFGITHHRFFLGVLLVLPDREETQG